MSGGSGQPRSGNDEPAQSPADPTTPDGPRTAPAPGQKTEDTAKTGDTAKASRDDRPGSAPEPSGDP
ncbi:peptidase, partial [Streptomyces sp. PD-S100-1]